MIELKSVTKTYYSQNKPIEALKNINLNIEAGEIYGILGKSGAGKSTLLRCVNLLEQPTEGHVIINNIDLTTLLPSKLKHQRKKISMIFQHFNLLDSRTALDNVALPLELLGESKSSARKQAQALLKLVHLEQHKNHYPGELSGGQKQRVAIARALATKPDVLLCDEATSALDTKSTASILALLKEINLELGLTILLITHELEVIKQICDRAGVLDDGLLVEENKVFNLFSNPKTEASRNLIEAASNLDLPKSIKEKLKPKGDKKTFPILRITFIGHDSEEPVLTNLTKNFEISVNILQANIESIQGSTLGFTTCQLTGDSKAINNALTYLHSLSIKTEVLGYA
jgi:D-methionine transport system ATP-binding protein